MALDTIKNKIYFWSGIFNIPDEATRNNSESPWFKRPEFKKENCEQTQHNMTSDKSELKQDYLLVNI